jgi:hypothetical protein
LFESLHQAIFEIFGAMTNPPLSKARPVQSDIGGREVSKRGCFTLYGAFLNAGLRCDNSDVRHLTMWRN